MNKRNILINVFIMLILMSTNIVYATNIRTDKDNISTIELDDEVQFNIDFEENIQTADFSVYFDSKILTYIGSSTENLKTNNVDGELLCCYYDMNKIGTETISLKFKANKETNKTNIKVTNITIHTSEKEIKFSDINSKDIKIINKNESNNIGNNIVNEVSNSENVNENNNINNISEDNTIAVGTLPKTGLDFEYNGLLIGTIVLVIGMILTIVIKNKVIKKVILPISIILVIVILFCSKFVFAENGEDDKIYINKQDKTILIILSTSNTQKNMNIQRFKDRTKAVSLDNNILSTGVTAKFKNNEIYTIELFGDENNDGYVNSSDIFELLNKENYYNEKITELSNFIIKKAEFNSYSKDGYEEFDENCIITPSLTPLEPAKDRYIEVNNIEELKLLNAKVGDKYKTLGYYEPNDGGAGRYDIIEMNEKINIDDGLYIELENGLIAKLAIINNTVNVKQFGAKGNIINDDTKYLNKAFNSGIENVEILNGEYKITDVIKLNTPFTNIIGNNSTIFTNNEFNPEKFSEFLFVINSDNCNVNNLNIEARETKNLDNLYKAQVYVGTTNVKIVGCSFKIPETTSNAHSYSNIDLYTGWHNVLIENCNLYLANDAKEGGCIWIRDLFNRSASDVTFTNNKCYKKAHDEILAVFMGSIENVNILNNTFIMDDSTDPSTMAFTLGSGSSKKAENIRFEGNTIDAKTTMDLIVSKNATNLSIKNNNIKYERVTTLTNNFVMYFPEDNLKNVVIESNNIEINNNTESAINGLISSKYNEVVFNNNNISINSDILEVFTGGMINTNNNITFNGNVKILVNKPKEFRENHIVFNNGFGAIAQYYYGNLCWNSNIVNNIFENKIDEISADEKSILLMFNGGTLNNYIVNFEGNVMKSEKANYRRNLIYLLNLSDIEPQTINIVNNKIEGYKEVWKDKNQDKHKITLNNI